MRDRVDAVENRMHVREPAHAIVLQRRDVLKPLETQVFDLRIKRRARLFVRRPFAFSPRHDEVIQRLFRAALRSRRLHFERRRFKTREVRAPDRKRRLVVAFVLGSFAHDVVDRRAKTRCADHAPATAVCDHSSITVLGASSPRDDRRRRRLQRGVATARIIIATAVSGSSTSITNLLKLSLRK